MTELLNCAICMAEITSNTELLSQYHNRVCKLCDERAVNKFGNPPEHDSMFDRGENPVYIDGMKCWRRYRFGGFITMLDDTDSETLEDFDKAIGRG